MRVDNDQVWLVSVFAFAFNFTAKFFLFYALWNWFIVSTIDGVNPLGPLKALGAYTVGYLLLKLRTSVDVKKADDGKFDVD